MVFVNTTHRQLENIFSFAALSVSHYLMPEIEQPLLKSFNHFLVLSEFRGSSSAERRWNVLLNLCN